MSLDARTSTPAPTTMRAMALPATDAATERPSNRRRSPSQHETGSAHRLDKRRPAKLAAEIRHVAIDAVLADAVFASPDVRERHAPSNYLPPVSKKKLEQIGFARAQNQVAAAATRCPGRHVEDEI